MDSSGNLLSENRYIPFGEVRTISGTTNISETDFGYTGQRDYSDDFGLMDYHARFYSPSLARFTQPDSIIPNFVNPQSLNRFSYTLNNPILFSDPDGHHPRGPDGEVCEAIRTELEETYNLDVTGEWTAEELKMVKEGINNVADLLGGADQLNNIIDKALETTGKSNFVLAKDNNVATVQMNTNYNNDSMAIQISETIFTQEYVTDREETRPPELGLDNIDESVSITFGHEFGHVIDEVNSEIVREFKKENYPCFFPNGYSSSGIDTREQAEEDFATAFGIAATMDNSSSPYYRFPYYEHMDKVNGALKLLREYNMIE